jgi:hypothetical protein
MAQLIPTPRLSRHLGISPELDALIDPIAPLDFASDATFDAWMRCPSDDDRTLEEFAIDGGRPVAILGTRSTRNRGTR